MHVLALVNQKGGCGKTTTAVNLAAALAARGRKTLLVDLDPQAHATLALGQCIENELSIVDVFRRRATVRECARRVAGGFDLVPANAALSEYEAIAARTIRPEHVLEQALSEIAPAWDVALLDCPPRADGIQAANALRAADTALLVIECGVFALQGAIRAVQVLEETASTLDRPFALRAVATLLDRRSRVAREVLVGMQAQFGVLLFDTAIRTSDTLRQAAAFGAPAEILAPRSAAAADFRALAEEVCAHVDARKTEKRSSSRARNDTAERGRGERSAVSVPTARGQGMLPRG